MQWIQDLLDVERQEVFSEVWTEARLKPGLPEWHLFLPIPGPSESAFHKSALSRSSSVLSSNQKCSNSMSHAHPFSFQEYWQYFPESGPKFYIITFPQKTPKTSEGNTVKQQQTNKQPQNNTQRFLIEKTITQEDLAKARVYILYITFPRSGKKQWAFWWTQILPLSMCSPAHTVTTSEFLQVCSFQYPS